MAQTPSTMLALDTPLPAFSLPDYNSRLISSADFEDQPVLVMFICNHCPYVKHIQGDIVDILKPYQTKGIQAVAINSNDFKAYPDDTPEKMQEVAERFGFTFPYLIDESQHVAKSFKAACTPDFFLFDKDHKLVYRGQLDDSRPGNDIPVTGQDLKHAMDLLLQGKRVPESEQTPSVGCNIKWRPGNAPDYF